MEHFFFYSKYSVIIGTSDDLMVRYQKGAIGDSNLIL